WERFCSTIPSRREQDVSVNVSMYWLKTRMHLVSIRKPKKGLKKVMYHAEIEIGEDQSQRIHHGQQSYNETEKCGLFSDATSVVAQNTAIVAQRAAETARWATPRRYACGAERDLVCAVDGMSMESSEEG